MSARCNILLIGFVLFFGSVQGQLVVTPAADLTDLLEDSFLGGGVEISNVVLTQGSLAEQIGSFNAEATVFPIVDGMIMSTGDISSALGPNVSASSGTTIVGETSDPDLDPLSDQLLLDHCVLEFDFVPQGNEISFNYIFASEEYIEFSNDDFNDVFAFFISSDELGLPPTNIALVPGTNLPVSIENLSDLVNSEFFIDNGQPDEFGNIPAPFSTDPAYIEFDGYTTTLQASAEVVCGSTYHFKLAIADAADSGYDSAVFLERNSLISPALEVELVQPEFFFNDSTAIEGCDFTTVVISRTGTDLALPLNVSFAFSGSAINGVDYQGIPETLVFDPGVTELSFDLIAFQDDLPEDTENVILTFEFDGVCLTNPEALQLEFFISDAPSMEINGPTNYEVCLGQTVTSELEVSGGLGQYTYEWDTGGLELIESFSPDATTSFQLIATDVCGSEISQDIIITVLDAVPELITQDYVGSCSSPLAMEVVYENFNGSADIAWEENGVVVSEGFSHNLSTGYSTVFNITATDGCGIVSQDFIEVLVDDPDMFLIISDSLQVCQGSVVQVFLDVQNAFDPLAIEWSGFPEITGPLLSFSPQESQAIEVTVTDACGRSESVSSFIEVSPVSSGYSYVFLSESEVQFTLDSAALCSGCSYFWDFGDGFSSTEINPLHEFESLGVYDVILMVTNPDGCESETLKRIEPDVLIWVPNAFTPDKDGLNEVWFAQGSGLVDYEIYIFNRWGETVYYSTDINDPWVGEAQEGSEHYVKDGIYTYLITYSGATNVPLEKRGVIHILR